MVSILSNLLSVILKMYMIQYHQYLIILLILSIVASTNAHAAQTFNALKEIQQPTTNIQSSSNPKFNHKHHIIVIKNNSNIT